MKATPNRWEAIPGLARGLVWPTSGGGELWPTADSGGALLPPDTCWRPCRVPTSAPTFGVRTEAGAWPGAWASRASGSLTTRSLGCRARVAPGRPRSNLRGGLGGRPRARAPWASAGPRFPSTPGLMAQSLLSFLALCFLSGEHGSFKQLLGRRAETGRTWGLSRRPLPAHGSLHR